MEINKRLDYLLSYGMWILAFQLLIIDLELID